jgi:hypothetical protein
LRPLAGLCLWLWLCGAFAQADNIELNPAHPDRYTVVKGDTLWDIAGKFLSRPWQWSEIWHNNPAIHNPDLIYPGDVLVLSYVDGKPRIQVETPSEPSPGPQAQSDTLSEPRLSPRVRSTPIEQVIPVIPMKAIRQFLSRPRVVGVDELKSAPYVVAFAGEHIVGGAGNRIHVRAIEHGTPDAYTVFRQGAPYKDAETGEILGYEAIYIGDSHLEQTGDPATLFLDHTELETRIGDRLLPVEQEQFRLAFQPHAPKIRLRGHIIGVLKGVSQIGQYSIVALDKGTADGIETGHVMEILQQGRAVRDIVSTMSGETVVMPDQKAGLLMVFRPYERISYALVMQATRALHVLDVVQTP